MMEKQISVKNKSAQNLRTLQVKTKTFRKFEQEICESVSRISTHPVRNMFLKYAIISYVRLEVRLTEQLCKGNRILKKNIDVVHTFLIEQSLCGTAV